MTKQKPNLKNRIKELRTVAADTLEPHPLNWRRHPGQQRTALRAVLEEIGFAGAILVRETKKGKLQIIDGHLRQEELKGQQVPVLITDLTEDEAKKMLATYDPLGAMAAKHTETLEQLLASLSPSGTNFEALLGQLRKENESASDKKNEARATLAQRFIVPPFSVLDARQGYWQDRKRAWLDLGIASHLGRGGNLLKMSDTVLEPDPLKRAAKKKATEAAFPGGGGRKNSGYLVNTGKGTKSVKDLARTFGEDLMKGENPNFGSAPDTSDTSGTGTSIFDPVLCELAYRWFVPDGGRILDPFAGGSVRGIVAAFLGYKYLGIDLRTEQVIENEKQAKELKVKGASWASGDSRKLTEVPAIKGGFDFIFSCPPYFDLELYSDDPTDLSNAKSYGEFIADYEFIIKESVAQLKDNRFACFVVGDIRDKFGLYRNFVSHTINAFKLAGAELYNEAILVTAVGSLPIRIAKQFEGYRKLGKTHQNVLVFYKGKVKEIPKHFHKVETQDVASFFGEVQ